MMMMMVMMMTAVVTNVSFDPILSKGEDDVTDIMTILIKIAMMKKMVL